MARTHKSARQQAAAQQRLAYQYQLIDALKALLQRSEANPVTDADIEWVATQFKVEISDLHKRWRVL